MSEKNKLKKDLILEVAQLQERVNELVAVKAEQKQALETLYDSERRFKTIFTDSVIGIDIVDVEGSPILANRALLEMLGYSEDELRSMVFIDYTHPDDSEESLRLVQEVREGKLDHFTMEKRYIRKDGAVIWGHTSVSGLRDAKGNFQYFIAMVEDITERVQAEESLRANEQRYRTVVEKSHNGIFIVSEDFKLEYVNDPLCKILRRSREEIVGHDFREFLDEESEKLVVDRYMKRQRGEEVPGRYEFNILRKDGGKRRVEISSAIVEDPKGKVRTIAQIMDITERVQAEKALGESEEKLRLMIDNSPIGFCGTDLKGNFIDVNPAMCLMLGYSKKELTAKHFNQVSHPDDREINQEMYQKLVEGKIKYFDLEKRYIHKNGKIVYVLIRSQLARNLEGEPQFEFALVEDITGRKLAEEKIQHLNLILRTIRNVNQLIVEEKNRDALIQKVCEILTENRGYINAWIVLLGEKGEYLCSAESGLGKSFTPLRKMLEKGELTKCGSRTLKKENVVRIEDPSKECGGCPLSRDYEGRSGFSVRLGHGENIYGLLTVSSPSFIMEDEKEQELFREIGGDIGFALHNIEAAEQSEKAEAQLKLQSLALESAANAIVITDAEGQILWTNPAFSTLTGYPLEEALGKNPRFLKSGQQDEKFYKNLWDTITAGEVWKGEITNKRFDGELYTEEMTIAPLVSKENEISNYIAIKQDITERARAEEEIRQRTEELMLINAINAAVNQGIDLPDIIKLLTEEAKRVFNSKSITVYLCSEDQKYLEMKNLAMPSSTVKRIEKLVGTSFPNIRIPLKEGSLTQKLLQADGPRLINDSEIIQEWMMEFTHAIDLSEKSRLSIQKLLSKIYKLVGVQSIISVPMILAGKPIGLMDFSRQEPFTEGDAKRVAGVVGQVTAAITSLRTEKERARNQRLLLTLSQAAPAVQRASNAEEIYSAIGEQVVKMGFKVTVFTLSDDKKYLDVSYQSLKEDQVRTIEKLTSLSAKNYSFPLKPEGYFHKIITSGETVFSHLDIKPIEETLPRLLRPLAIKVMDLIGKQQSIIAPLAVGGEVHGLLSISSSDLSESDVPAITTFANQAAIALEKTRLFHETQELAGFNESIVQNMAEGIVLQDTEGIFTFVNPAAGRMLGYTSEELVGMHWKEVVPPDQHPLIREADERRVRGESDRYELDLIGKDSQQISVLVGGSPLFDRDGHFRGTIGVFTDITERKRAEEKLSRFSRIFEDSLNEIYLFKTDTLKFTQVNRAGQNNLGYTMEELGELTPIDIKPEFTVKSFAELVAPLRKSETERIVFETVHKRKNGSPYEVEVHLQLLHYDKEALFSAIIMDITERKQSEEAMLKYTHQLETLNTTTAALSTSLELDHVLELILGQIGQVLPFDSGAIFLHDEGKLRVMADRGIKPSVKGHVYFSENELFQEIQRTGLPLIVSNTKEDPRFQNWGQSENVASWMGVPLIVRDTMIGYLTLDSIQLNSYSDEQADLALTFASQAAQAIENAHQVSAAQHRMKQLDALLNIDQAIMGSFDLKVTLNIILEQLRTQLAIDAAVVLIYQVDLQTLQFAQGRGLQTVALQYTDLRLGEGYAGEVGLQRDHVFIPDLNQDEGKIQKSPQFSKEGFVAYYGVPLIAKGKLVGVLEIFQRSSLNPDHEWVNYLRLLSSQVAIAIENITMFNDLQRSNVDLTLAYDATIEGWAHALELKDMETEGHSRRVVELTMNLAREMKISGEKMGHIRRGAMLHDIGKMGIPDSILQKPGKLNDKEWQIMRQHPVFAFEWLSPIQYLQPALEIPYAHHEKWDGTGYPRGLEGEQIPLAARIFAIVDVWDALNSDRPYRKAWSKEKILDHIEEQSGKHFDPRVADAFLELIETERK